MTVGIVSRLAESRLTVKFLVISLFTLGVFALALFGAILPKVERDLLGVHKESLKSLVGTITSLLTEYDNQVKRGDLSLEEAQKRALHRIKQLRYGNNDYFWVNDVSRPIPRMIMHPTVPSLDGKVLDDPKFNCASQAQQGVSGQLEPTPGGKANLFSALLDATKATGDGYIVYTWPKPVSGGVTKELYPKLSYGVAFLPWGWLIGSGVYIDNIQARVSELRLAGAAVLAVVFVLGLGVTFWLTRAFVGRQLDALVAYSGRVAAGDLGAEPPMAAYRAETRVLRDAMTAMVSRLRESLSLAEEKTREAGEQARQAEELAGLARQAQEQAESARREGGLVAVEAMAHTVSGVDAVSRELSGLLNQAARGTDQQRRSAEHTASEVEDVTRILERMSQQAADVAALAGQASDKAHAGSGVVGRSAGAMRDVTAQAQALSESMHQLGRQSDAIGAILTTIADIADQTNLLALNAAIEAARAGDAGRGFAVVADEVRKLAEKTMHATQEVARSVKAIQEGAARNVAHMDRAVQAIDLAAGLTDESGEVFEDIVEIVGLCANQTSSIAGDASKQSEAMGQVSRAVEDIARVAADIAGNAGDSLEALHRLEREQASLAEVMRRIEADAHGRAKALGA